MKKRRRTSIFQPSDATLGHGFVGGTWLMEVSMGYTRDGLAITVPILWSEKQAKKIAARIIRYYGGSSARKGAA